MITTGKRLLEWARARDRGLGALRRATRTAIFMPALFAFGDKVLANAEVATFAAFGAFAMLLLVDFGGPMRSRLEAQASLAVVGGAFVCLGTVASRSSWLAACAMALVGFLVLFAGVVSSVMAGATTSLLMSFILPVSLSAPVSSLPDRLAGWGLASLVSFLAVALLWPAPARDPLRGPLVAACRALAQRVRELPTGGHRAQMSPAPGGTNAEAALRSAFFATPYRPTSLGTSARALVRMVDEVGWLDAIVTQTQRTAASADIGPESFAVRQAAAAVLDHGADLLSAPEGSPSQLREDVAGLRRALGQLELSTTSALPSSPADFISALDPSFRAQELSFATVQIATNIDLAVVAEGRTWLSRLLGQQPSGFAGPLTSARQRAASNLERHSVWLHNSIRGAAGLGLAVLLADLTDVQHSFWVVLAMLSVLRSNALSTGQNVLRGLSGTVVGFVVGAGLLALIGTNTTLLWGLLPLAILFAGFAPAAISFAAGQAGFTLTLVILFNIVQPAGWKVGLIRVEDIALGCAVSLAVGLLFWPRGAAAGLGQALSEAYGECATYLASAVELGIGRCDGTGPKRAVPLEEAARAAAAARRLDDAFRGYLAERGAKPLPLAEVTSLVTGVAGLRMASDAVLDLWRSDDRQAGGDRTAARRELQASAQSVAGWYRAFAGSLASNGEVPDPLDQDTAAGARIAEAVRNDLLGADGHASAAAVRMIWTGDHLDAARRMQRSLVGPARAATAPALRARPGSLVGSPA